VAGYTGSRYLISGSYVVENNEIKITYRFEEYDNNTLSTLIGDVEISGLKEDVQMLCSDIILDVIGKTGIVLPSESVVKINLTRSNLALMWASRCVGLAITGKAIGFASAAIENDPEFVLAYKLLGDAYRFEKSYESAKSSYEMALTLNPENSSIYIVNGINYFMLGKEKIENLIFVDSTLVSKLKETEELLSTYDFMRDDENFTTALNELISTVQSTYFTTGIISEPELPFAIDTFLGIIVNDEYLSGVVSSLMDLKGEIENSNNRNKDKIPTPDEFTLAIEQYKKALEINPSDVNALIRLAKIYEETGRRGDAIDIIKKVLEINDRQADVYNMLGNDLWYYAVETKSPQWKTYFNDAISAYTKSLEIQPTKAMTHYNIASLYLKLENASKAIEHFERYLELDPDSPYANDVRKTIENLRAGKY